MITRVFPAAFVALVITVLARVACAEDNRWAVATTAVESTQVVRIYRSPAERREAGLGRHINELLTASGLAEIETEHSERMFSNSRSNDSTHLTDKTLQLGLSFSVRERLTAELVLEHEIDVNHTLVDEALIVYEGEVLSLEAGRLYLPFGEYYSHFVTGPILEFGETRGDAIVADVTLSDSVDLIAYALYGRAEKPGESAGRIDWGTGLDFANDDESVKFSIAYFSDLAESEAELLGDFRHQYHRRVGGFSAHTLIGFDRYEVTAEYVGALRSFNELDAEENQPWAANVEFSWFPVRRVQLSARIEASADLADEPQRQYGLSAAWLIADHVNFAVDYLYGHFRQDSAFDDDDHEITHRHLLAAQLSLEF